MVASAVLGLSGFLAYAQMGGGTGHGRTIEFSTPKDNKGAITNLSQFPGRKDNLKKLEDELNRSSSGFSPKGSLDPAMPAPVFRPAPTPVYQDRRTQELLEKRKNWAFAQPEDWAMGTAGENFFDSSMLDPATDPGKNGAPTDPVLESLIRQQGVQRPGAERKDDPRAILKSIHQKDELDDLNLPSGIRENAQSLRKYLDEAGGDSLSGLAPNRTSFSDLLGPGDKALSPADVLARKNPVDQYRQLIEGSSKNMLSPLLDRQGEASRKPVSANGLEGLASSSRHEGLGGTPADMDTVTHPAALPDVNQKVLKRWDPLYAPPPPEPVKSGPICVPMAEAPRRKF